LEKASVDLVHTAPTTPAGIVTAIEYMRRQMRNDGTYMPYDELYEGDGGIVLGWIDVWLDTIVEALGNLAVSS
jgi:hypothetical protein